MEGGLWGVYVCVCVSTHSAMHCNRLPIRLDHSRVLSPHVFLQSVSLKNIIFTKWINF